MFGAGLPKTENVCCDDSLLRNTDFAMNLCLVFCLVLYLFFVMISGMNHAYQAQ